VWNLSEQCVPMGRNATLGNNTTQPTETSKAWLEPHGLAIGYIIVGSTVLMYSFGSLLGVNWVGIFQNWVGIFQNWVVVAKRQPLLAPLGAGRQRANSGTVIPTVCGKPKVYSSKRDEENEREDRERLPPSQEKWTNQKNAWAWLLHNSKWGNDVHVFDDIVISRDLGLSEIGLFEGETGDAFDQLWYVARPFSSAVLILFVVCNLYYIFSMDVQVIQDHLNQTSTRGEEWLVTEYILKTIYPSHNVDTKVCITCVELAILTTLFVALVEDVYGALCRRGYKKWKGVAEICWVDLPRLSIFSAIKLLEHITPQKVSYGLFVIFFYIQDKRKMMIEFFKFLVSRPLCLIIGMDTFLIKYRLVYANIAKPTPHFSDITAALIFLNQVIGINNRAFVIKNRLYRFVFAGEEGVMENEQEVVRDVWEAFVAEKVITSGRYPWWKAWSIMLSWCDDDVQRLFVDDRDYDLEEKEEPAAKDNKGGCVVA